MVMIWHAWGCWLSRIGRFGAAWFEETKRSICQRQIGFSIIDIAFLTKLLQTDTACVYGSRSTCVVEVYPQETSEATFEILQKTKEKGIIVYA